MNAQINYQNPKTALLIIDIQEFYFPGDGPGLNNAIKTSEAAREVLEIFREKEQLIVHVRHQSDKGIEIHQNVKPNIDEKIITKNEINSFLGTDLKEYLDNNHITHLIIIGMQTQMCVEAAVRAAYDFGFECIVIGDACTTRDLKFDDKQIKAMDVHYCTLATLTGGGYSKVIDLKSFKDDPDSYIFSSK